VNAHRHHPASVVVALPGMHLADACAGAGIGILIAPPLRTRVGTAVAGITGLTLLSLAVPWLPPLNPVLQATFRRVSPAPGLLWLAAGQAAALGWPAPSRAPRWPGPGARANPRRPAPGPAG
jgi:hypothetical protein